GDRAGLAVDRSEEIELQSVMRIGAAHAQVGVAAAAEDLRQDIVALAEIRIARVAAVTLRRGAVGKVAIVALARPLVARGVDLAAVKSRALVGVADQVVRRRHCLELVLGLLVAGVEVGMQLLRQPAIGLLNVVLRRVLLDAKDLIGIGAQRPLLFRWVST